MKFRLVDASVLEKPKKAPRTNPELEALSDHITKIKPGEVYRITLDEGQSPQAFTRLLRQAKELTGSTEVHTIKRDGVIYLTRTAGYFEKRGRKAS